MAGSRSSLRTILIIAAAAGVVAAASPLWLGWLGAYLVNAEQPFPADIIVVLAGDGYGHRIVKAAELVKQGYAPRVLVSGAPGFYGIHEDALAIPFAVQHGYPDEWFIHFPNDGRSTVEEADAILGELRRRGVKRFILLTSDYHTRRAGAIYRKRVSGMEMRVVAAPDESFTASGWWHSREGRKTTFLEWMKTLTGPLGI